jgi:radical SAM protein with 4Fe4S-binding SPASM domain
MGGRPAAVPIQRLNAFQEAFNARRAHLDKLPETVFIELAMACNLRCEMCPVPKNMELMGSRARLIMKPDIFRQVLNDLSGSRHSLCLNQMGEPLLNKHVATYVGWAKADGHRVGFYTNGTLLDKETSNALLGAGLDYIVFSIDGATKKTFESIRIGANFESTIENIKYFCGEAKKPGRSCHAQVHMIISDLTEGEKEEFVAFWKEHAETQFIPLDDWAGQLELPQKFGKPRTSKSKAERYPCNLLWTALYISAEGNVMYCCHDYKHASRLSNVMRKSLLEIWTQEVSKEREKHVQQVYETGPCKDCNAWQTRSELY